MERFVNYFEVSEDLYCEALYKMIPLPRFFIYGIATILLGVSAIVMFLGKNYQTGIMWLILSFLLGVYGFLGIKLKAKKFYRSNLSAISDKNGVFWKRTVFYEDKFKVEEPKSTASFKYNTIRAVNESKNLYVLLLEDKQLLFIKKDAFINADDKDFVAFLKMKCNAE